MLIFNMVINPQQDPRKRSGRRSSTAVEGFNLVSSRDRSKSRTGYGVWVVAPGVCVNQRMPQHTDLAW